MDERANDLWRDATVTYVDVHAQNSGWTVLLSDRSMIPLARADFDPDVPADVAPRVGDLVRVYGPDVDGERIHGIDLNGRRLWYRTEAERRAYDEAMSLRDVARFARDQEQLDAQVAALSPPLRRRIERLRRENPDFRVTWEAYELASCVDADLIARYLRRQHGWAEDATVSVEQARQAVEAFKNLGGREQYARVPKLQPRHSGATFGRACSLTIALLVGWDV